MKQFTIGLSGHIDHGKTSIVESLTGKNTDSLKEEIVRGMTINIGFSFLTENITLIDVPGHEKFIKNMLAGINAIDYVLLVIAADDGIMPQTIEHFEILKLLNIKKGSIILNKIDLVDSEWITLVESDIDKFTQDTFLENCEVHKISTKTNEGINELKNHLINYQNFDTKYDNKIFRLFVDRAFISKGFGTVVTGTVISGKVSIGQKIKILPHNKTVNIRGLQTHEKSVDELNFGDRGAINFQSLDKIEISRGNHLSDKNFFDSYESAFVFIQVLAKSNKIIQNNERLRVYVGTQEVMARIFFADKKQIDSGISTYALLKFEKPIVIAWNDIFIVRTYSPLTTIGGGKIVDVNCFRKWKENKKHILRICNISNESELVEKIIYSNKMNPFTFSTLGTHLSINDKAILTYISKNKNINIFDDNWLITNEQLSYLEIEILKYFKDFHVSNPYRIGALKEEILNVFLIDYNFLDSYLRFLCESEKIKVKNNLFFKSDFKISLSKTEIELCEKILLIIEKQKFNSFSQNELINELKISEGLLKKMLKMQIDNNNLIIVDGNLIFSKNNINELIKKIKKYFSANDSMDIGEFKNIADTSRKYAVPLLEYFDKDGLTYRVGNVRKLNE